MSLLAEVQEAASQGRKVQCPVLFAYEALDSADQDDLRTALADLNIAAAVIQKVLVGRGHRMGQGAVATHRNGRCSCHGTLG